jgi:predicted nucleotidyltransferase
MVTAIAEDEIISRFSAMVRARLGQNLKRIILFGSRARGEATEESDYDCLVVVDEVDANVKECLDDIAGELLYEHSAVVSAFPISERASETRRYSPFLRNIRKEGIVL